MDIQIAMPRQITWEELLKPNSQAWGFPLLIEMEATKIIDLDRAK